MNDAWFGWLAVLSVAASAVLAGRKLVHYFQLESYQFPGYFRTLSRNLLRAVSYTHLTLPTKA